jgi:hypothetical protein
MANYTEAQIKNASAIIRRLKEAQDDDTIGDIVAKANQFMCSGKIDPMQMGEISKVVVDRLNAVKNAPDQEVVDDESEFDKEYNSSIKARIAHGKKVVKDTCNKVANQDPSDVRMYDKIHSALKGAGAVVPIATVAVPEGVLGGLVYEFGRIKEYLKK